MEYWVNYLPVTLFIIATLVTLFEKVFKKDNNSVKAIIGGMVVLSCALQIFLNIYNKRQDDAKEIIAENQRRIFDKKIGLLNRQIDSLTSIIIYKEDGISSFIKVYFLKDSITKNKYDSLNKIVIENDRPQMIILDPLIIKERDKGRYVTTFSIENIGKRSLTNLTGTQYIITNNYDRLGLYGKVSIVTSKSDILSKDFTLKSSAPLWFDMNPSYLKYSLYFYITGTYDDLITKTTYTYKTLFRTGREIKQTDTINLILTRGWELDKVESFLGFK